MNKFLTFLEGYRTYFLGIAGALINLLQVFGLINWTAPQLVAVNGFLLTVMGVTQRMATAKVEKKVDNQ